jgi:soluble lytic murein transglycosylase-like protein
LDKPQPAPLAAVALAAAMLAGMHPGRARADCIDDAAAHHGVNPLVLRAIGWQESRLRPGAVGRNANGTVDIGAFQINSIHLRRLAAHGVGAPQLADGCVSAYVAAWHYRRQVAEFGDTWQAVGAYHSRTPALSARYAKSVAAIVSRWQAGASQGRAASPAGDDRAVVYESELPSPDVAAAR